MDEIRRQFETSIAVKQAMLNAPSLLLQLQHLGEACLQAMRVGGRVLFAGNGGSFADAQHLSAEFTSRLMFDRSPLPSLALGTNSSAMSAIGNDYGYDQVFARELQAIAKREDVFIPISTSGNSPNVLAAVRVAQAAKVTTVAWTGASGGQLKELCECICVPSSETPRIQECHVLMGHVLCGVVEAAYFRTGVQV